MSSRMSFPSAAWLATAVLALVLIAACGNAPEETATADPTPVPPSGTVRADLCGPHQLPVADCFMCDPALRDPGRLWCLEHDRYEDRCFLCHPDIREEGRLWCAEHNLYEDECFFCHPELKPTPEDGATDSAPATGAATPGSEGGLFCSEHRVFENECGICHPELAGELAVGQGLKIRFESARSAEKAGVRLTRPVEGAGLSNLAFLGEVRYNRNRFARITPLAAGVLRRVLVDVGERVRAGQPLAVIAAPDIADARSAYLDALAVEKRTRAEYERKKALLERNIAPRRDYEAALADLDLARSRTETARQQLLNFGFDADAVAEIADTRTTTSTLHVVAPFDGTIVERAAVIGERAAPGDMLFTLADLTTMWLDLSIPEDRLVHVAVGDAVEASFETLPDLRLEGRLSWLSAGVDPHTRMLRARAEIPNPGRVLKDGMYGQARMMAQRQFTGVLVPSESLHHFDDKPFVFARVEDDLYEVRRVEIGGRQGNVVAIRAGLRAGDEVVSQSSFTVKSEFLKARLGAGCVDH